MSRFPLPPVEAPSEAAAPWAPRAARARMHAAPAPGVEAAALDAGAGRAAPVLVVPVALTAASEAALPLALALAERLGASVHLVHVLGEQVDGDGAPRPSPTATARREQHAHLRLDAMRMLYRYALPGRVPVAVSPVVLPPAPLARALAAYVATVGAALVLAPAGRSAVLDGGVGVSGRVADLAAAVACPLLVVPAGRSLSSLTRMVIVGAAPSSASPAAFARAVGLMPIAASAPLVEDLTWIASLEG